MVGSVITPSSPVNVHERGRIQFAVSSSYKNGRSEKWSSEDPDIVSINPSSGRAIAEKAGKTNVHFSDTIFYTTKVNVFRADRIALNMDSHIRYMTNIYENQAYREQYHYSFRVYSGEDQIDQFFSEDTSVNNDLKFICQIEPAYENLFVISSELVGTSVQTPTCVIQPKRNYPKETDVRMLVVFLCERKKISSCLEFDIFFLTTMMILEWILNISLHLIILKY